MNWREQDCGSTTRRLGATQRIPSAAGSTCQGRTLSPRASGSELSGHFQSLPTVTAILLSLHTHTLFCALP